MMGFDSIKSNKINELVERANEYEFPELISMLRESVGSTRKKMSEEVKISEYLLFRWEHGEFKKCIKPMQIAKMSDYYQVPFKFLNTKMKEFLEKE